METMLRINRVFLRLSCRQLSSMWLWWSQKQADGEEFCFQMEEKPICRKKRQLVHLNRLQVAGRQKAKSRGARSGPGSVCCPQTRRTMETNTLCSPLIMLVCWRPAWPGHQRPRERQPTEARSLPTLTSMKHQVLLFAVVQQWHVGVFY